MTVRIPNACRNASRILAITILCGLSTSLDLLAQQQEISAAVLKAQQERVKVMDKAASATISIFGLDGGGGGSGVIISPDGYALTNYHVSSACGDHMRCGLNDGRVYDAVIVGVDATGDVSLIKLYGREDFPTAALADSDQVKIGQWCFAAGNPFVLASNRQPSVSMGIVSGVNRYQYPAGTLLEYADCIQTDAAINPGNSGGPLFNMQGEVIGINGRCSFEKRGRINVGVGYAISANQIKKFLGMLKSGRLVDHATLGATVSTDDSGRVLVSNILSDSDAFRRGLRFGDEVMSLADREVRTTNNFKNILGTLPKGWRVPLTFRRDGQEQTILVRLTGVHSQQELTKLVMSEVPQSREPEEADDPEKEKPKAGSGDDSLADRLSQLPVELAQGRADEQLIKSKLETRSGFSNYYFNRVRREQLWKLVRGDGEFSTDKRWLLSGTLAGEATEYSAFVGRKTGELKLGATRKLQVSFEGGLLSDIVAKRNESGLLLAVKALADFLSVGPEKLGESTYIGKLPVYRGLELQLADQPLHDVIETLWYDSRIRFYIDESAGEVSLVEVYGDNGVDPIEVYFSDYQEPKASETASDASVSGAGWKVPNVIRLQYGTLPTLVLQVADFDRDATWESDQGLEEAGNSND